MSETNGAAKNQLGETSQRNEKGQLLPGHDPLPGGGRPPGSMDFMAICRRRARELDIDLEDLVWEAAFGLFGKAAMGDAAAGKIVLDRTCGLLEKGLEVNVDLRGNPATGQPGPPLLPPQDFGAYLTKLNEIADRVGIKLVEPDPEIEALLE